jgi:hypothetical protein
MFTYLTIRGVYSSIIPPPPGVGEKNQRVLGLGKKIKEEKREKKRKISVGNS